MTKDKRLKEAVALVEELYEVHKTLIEELKLLSQKWKNEEDSRLLGGSSEYFEGKEMQRGFCADDLDFLLKVHCKEIGYQPDE